MKFLAHIDLSKNQLQNAIIHPLGTEPTGVEGQIYYNSSVGDKKLYIHNGSGWVPVGDITSVASTTSQLTVTSGTTGAVSLALDVASSVTNGGTGLVTSDLLYDYITGGTVSVTSITAGTGISVNSSTGAVTITNTDLGSSQAIFKNIAVAGQSTVVADSNNDTLTLAAGSNVTITTNATTDTVTISSTDTNTTYSLSTGTPSGGASIFLDGSDLSQDSIKILGTANEIEVSNVLGDIIIGLPNDVVIAGNLTVNGTTTTVNTETINLADNIITLNSNYTGSTPTENGGIEIERGTIANVSLVWNESTDRWTFTNDGSTFYNIPISGDATVTSISISQGNGITVADTSVGTVKSFIVSANNASETAVGVIELATQAEVNAGTDTVRAVTPATLATYIANQAAADSYAVTLTATSGAQTVTHGLGTSDVIVQLFDTINGEVIYADIARSMTTPFAVTVTFVTAPTNPVRALVQKID